MTNEQALFPKKNLTDEIPYFPLLFTHCSHCGKRIIIQIPKSYSNQKKNTYWSCNDCVGENSAIRNDIDEAFLTDVSDYLFGERDWEDNYLIKHGRN